MVIILDFQKILVQLANGELDHYEVEPKNAFEFQAALRSFEKRQNITGKALRGGKIIYSKSKSEV